jgi:hypothetical protein
MGTNGVITITGNGILPFVGGTQVGGLAFGMSMSYAVSIV